MSNGTSQQSQGFIVIKSILSNISENNIHELESNLNRLPISVVSIDQSEALLKHFIDQSMNHNNIDALRLIIKHFDLERIRVDPLPALTNLFLNPLLSRDHISFVISCFPEKTPIDYFVDLVNMGDDNMALRTAGIIITYFPNITNSDWSTLVSLTDNFEDEEYENQLLRLFFQKQASATSFVISKPSWIVNVPFKTPDTIPNMPSVKTVVDLLIPDLDKFGISINSDCDNDLRDNLISQYSISTITEKIQLMSHVIKIDNYDDSSLFQEYGPVNTVYSECENTHPPDHICSKYGGCRMLLCSEFETMYHDGDDIDLMSCDTEFVSDWFRGSCDVCLKKTKRHYCIRMPLKHGGWFGCYCSFECMESLIENASTALMVGRIKEQLSVFGIRERED
jgi:hypothetical protein